MTKIEWLQRPGTIAESWNPIQDKRKGPSGRGYHCTKCSPGCVHCWAETMNKRFGNELPFDNSPVEFEIVEKVLDAPLRWRKPRTVGVQLMGDLFHEDVRTELIGRVLDIIASAPTHTFLLLTKRPQRMQDHVGNYCEMFNRNHPLPNVIGMVTAENQEQADIRIPILLRTPFARRGVSVEPMLGEITHIPHYLSQYDYRPTYEYYRAAFPDVGDQPIRTFDGIDWVIVGGESGPGARPMKLDWVRDIRDQCQAAGVLFLFKQKIIAGKKVSLPELDGKVWNEYPEAICAEHRA